MKYIRTKEGIYEFPKGFTEFNWNNKTLLENEEHIVWTGGEVIAQADTIEELCDEFVCDHNNGTRVIQIKECKPQFPLCEDTIDYFKRNNQTFYGAIWTNKGLIYVAKTNDKGELELL